MQHLCDIDKVDKRERDEKMKEKKELKSQKTYRKNINMEEVYKRLNAGESVQSLAYSYGIDRSTLYRRISDFEKKDHDQIEKYLKKNNGEIYSFKTENEKNLLIAYQKNLEQLIASLNFFELKVDDADPYSLKIKSKSGEEISINFFDKSSILDFRIWEK